MLYTMLHFSFTNQEVEWLVQVICDSLDSPLVHSFMHIFRHANDLGQKHMCRYHILQSGHAELKGNSHLYLGWTKKNIARYAPIPSYTGEYFPLISVLCKWGIPALKLLTNQQYIKINISEGSPWLLLLLQQG